MHEELNLSLCGDLACCLTVSLKGGSASHTC